MTMFSRIHSAGVLGIDAYIVEVETDLEYRLPTMILVGLAEGAVRESRERVSSAVKNSGFSFPQTRVTVNLAPADVKKEGSAFDLPVAVGILAANGQIDAAGTDAAVFVGELSLDGSLRPVRGVLSIALKVRDAGFSCLILPEENAAEAALVQEIAVRPARTLREVADFCNGRGDLPAREPADFDRSLDGAGSALDISDVRGQAHVKRALEIAAAGGHNLLMIGPPGSGKTMLAKRLPSILPGMTRVESLETTKVHSVAGILDDTCPLVTARPFRSPHHTISEVALIGGGHYPKPGEISMAHNGVLFLDEFPELGKKYIESLRQPLEDGVVTISRATYSVSFPAVFMMIAAMNPCPCGYRTDPAHECTCSVSAIQRYLAKISGPIMDRIDLHVDVPAVRYEELSANSPDGDSSAVIRRRVDTARDIQKRRFRKLENVHANAHIPPRHVGKYCSLDEDGERILRRCIDRFGFSARTYHRILRVARTIADLSHDPAIKARHISEAVQYRTLDRE